MEHYTFGVEIEVIAEPHTIHDDASYELYYGKLAAALKKRGQKALADDPDARYQKHPEHYNKWWITRDGSLMKPMPKFPKVAFEAVSPILDSRKNWEVVIETFWTAYRKVFHLPKKFKRVGSHVHISVPGGFRLDQLKDIAKGIALHEDRLYQILPVERRDSKYCKPNTEHSNLLNGRSLREIYQMIDNVTNKRYLVNVMQGPNAKDDRYVLWNFANIVKQSETLEFRGGRCLRGEIRTKRWIAFTVGFVEACLGADSDFWEIRSTSDHAMKELFIAIRNGAKKHGMAHYMPKDYRVMNESRREGNDAESDNESLDSSDSDSGSIVSKGGPMGNPRCIIL